MAQQPLLLFLAAAQVGAVPLQHVREVMRCLPIETLSDVPPFVLGVSVVRGVPTPVVDAAALFWEQVGAPTRFVSLRVEQRSVALAVDAVLGIEALDESTVRTLPPLVSGPSRAFETLRVRDAQLFAVVSTAHVVDQVPVDPRGTV